MAEVYGEFTEMPDRVVGEVESLDLTFWPSRTPLQQRWRNNGLSADFLGDYVTTFFPLDESNPATLQRQANVRGAASYVANELLENAMKFTDESVPEPVTIRMWLDDRRIVFLESNGAGDAAAAELRAFIERLLNEDTAELYFSKLEETALSNGGSGLGYLTMINDYGARLAWRFEPLPSGAFRVATQVTIAI